ncbi:MAG: GMC family oxidoreductase, partial [Calditrichales bacterium]
LKDIARQIGKESEFEPTDVAIFFGEADKTVADPYFGGKGPDRSGCNFCGGCMVGCRFNAKNTLDKNYLYLAQKLGAVIQAESKVYDVKPLTDPEGVDGYHVSWKKSTSILSRKGSFTCSGVIFSAGVLGTVPLLMKLKKTSLPNLSGMVGSGIRTNSESLTGVTVCDHQTEFSQGIAIGSILHTDAFSHIEPVRYPAGSGAWRLLLAPLVHGPHFLSRLGKVCIDWIRSPIKNLRVYFVDDWAKRTQILLFMQTINTTLKFTPGIFGTRSKIDSGEKPPTFIPEAKELAEKFARIVDGKATALLTETLFGIPTTAHILGGAVMGANEKEGVIDKDNRVFGYANMYVCDGAMISANPGVNPSLTITALSERAMSKISPDN